MLREERFLNTQKKRDLQKATYNFTTMIGHGAFGPVYKAKMSTGETVAVKVLATNSKQGEKEFQTEVDCCVRMETKKSNMGATASKSKLDASDEYESSSAEEEELERELADVSFEELQKARSNGFHSVHQKPKADKKVGRANKNRPMEISSKKPVGRFREVIQAPKKVIRDPRFESLCGTLDTDGFRKRYNFLFETELPTEKEEFRKLMKKSNDPKVIADLKDRISSIDKQLKAGSAKRTDAQILGEHKKKEREAAKQGKRPFYLKKSEIREQRLIEKYNSLKAAGKLDSFIEKRRKKNASKDHRYMPYRRSSNSEQQQ